VRIQYTVVVLLIAIVGAPTVSLTGQEEPLPAIHARNTFEPLTPEIVLAVDPIHDAVQPTLADAVRANDYATFDALYRRTPVPAFTLLHELWTYSLTDPVGAFYGAELHDRLVSAYPGYAAYIEEFRIVDSNGNVFYPTSETRAFLLDRAIEGRAPRVLLAERIEPRRETRASRSEAPVTRRRSVAPAPKKAAVRPAETPQVTVKAPVEPAVVASPVAPAVVETTPVPTPAVAQTTPVVEAAPVVQMPAPAAANDFGSRGILLLVIGLVGIGILAMMLRAPREEQAASIMPPQTTVPPPPVEPFRGQSASSQPRSGKNRASGSHG
jgi:hypothetical protein